MSTRVAGLILVAVALGGCTTTIYDIHFTDKGWSSPEGAFKTFRAAMLAKRPDILYESLSPGFIEREGVPGLREFKAGFEHYESDFELFAEVLERSRVVNVRYAVITEENVPGLTGRRVAKLDISAGDMEAEFILVDIPTWEITVLIPEYGAETVLEYLPGTDFSAILEVRDGAVFLKPLDASGTGVIKATEVLGISLTHQWLLEKILKLPIDVSALMSQLSAVGTQP